jgi:lactoylglutathione lyase
MKLGAFSISLSVKDIHASKAFYEKLGFKAMGGDISQNWVILKNEQSIIGLFQGMFADNIITFNPGWDQDAAPVIPFDDVRTIQRQLKAKEIAFLTMADETTEGPGSLMLKDPDGNVILIDQHV